MSDREDPELATRAPESDAMETTEARPGTDAVPTSTGMGEHCVTDRPTPSGSASSGELIKLDDIDVYVSKPSDYPHAPSKLLLFLSSGTGIHSINNQLQADAFAKEGFLVVMPDQFNKDPAPNSSDVDTAAKEAGSSVLEQVKLHAAGAVQSFMIDMWLARQTPERVRPILDRVIKAAKEEFADALSSGGGLYAVGYCFGGKYVLQLASSTKPQTKAGVEESSVAAGDVDPVIRAGAFAHGTSITSQDFRNVQAPLCIVAVENDQLFPDEHREAGQEILQAQKVENEIKIYPEVPHGFAVVGDYKDEKIQVAQKEAFAQMLSWLKTH